MESTADSGSAMPLLFYYLYPGAVFFYFIAASLFSVLNLHHLRPGTHPKTQSRDRRAAAGLLGVFALTYVVQLVVSFSIASSDIRGPPAEHNVVGNLSCLLVVGIQLLGLSESSEIVWYPYQGTWVIALAFEAALSGCLIFESVSQALATYETTELILALLRCTILLALSMLSLLQRLIHRLKWKPDLEREPLLIDRANVTRGGYGSTPRNGDTADEELEYGWQRCEREGRNTMEARLKEDGNWFAYSKSFMIFFPYIWPVGSRALQARAAGVILCLLVSNVLSVLIPRQTAIILDSLASPGEINPWVAVAVFAALRLASSDSGIELVRKCLWNPVQAYSLEAMSCAAYSHIMHLSADFHDSKSSSDTMTAMHGGRAISSVVERILFQAVPMLIDMCVAIIYLSATFGPYEGFITLATGTVFFLMASRLVAKSKVVSRQRITALFKENRLRHLGFSNWQTVSAFNQIEYEDNRYSDAVASRWARERKYLLNWNLSIALQTMVLTCGLSASAFLAVHQIRAGKASPGQFAMLLVYWSQLTSPLQFFAGLGKTMSDEFIDAERLLAVMKTRPTVQNREGAGPLEFSSGSIKFDNVSFDYDGQKGVIKGLSLDVPAGQTVALVGGSGAGKTTLLKLLHRFYDVTDGCVTIDGQDIREVDVYSLRDRIGLVPQDVLVFDDTIFNNIRYAKLTASKNEVVAACRAACIHDKIESFTNGYDSRVGERGVKLSGGERQRMAIARAILKDPGIVLLDEATSSVDTDTEQQIQLSLGRLCKDRTTLIVAHRLSTIKNADLIVVIEHGKVVEQGSHRQLLAKNGRYADLWEKQFSATPSEKLATTDSSDCETAIFDGSSIEEAAAELNNAGRKSSESEETSRDEEANSNGTEIVRIHQKEGSNLNPVAPEFTPKQPGGAQSKDSSHNDFVSFSQVSIAAHGLTFNPTNSSPANSDSLKIQSKQQNRQQIDCSYTDPRPGQASACEKSQ